MSHAFIEVNTKPLAGLTANCALTVADGAASNAPRDDGEGRIKPAKSYVGGVIVVVPDPIAGLPGAGLKSGVTVETNCGETCRAFNDAVGISFAPFQILFVPAIRVLPFSVAVVCDMNVAGPT